MAAWNETFTQKAISEWKYGKGTHPVHGSEVAAPATSTWSSSSRNHWRGTQTNKPEKQKQNDNLATLHTPFLSTFLRNNATHRRPLNDQSPPTPPIKSKSTFITNRTGQFFKAHRHQVTSWRPQGVHLSTRSDHRQHRPLKAKCPWKARSEKKLSKVVREINDAWLLIGSRAPTDTHRLSSHHQQYCW